jgi:hypothetical protein
MTFFLANKVMLRKKAIYITILILTIRTIVCLLMFPFDNMASLGHFYKEGYTKEEKQSIALGIWLQKNSCKEDAIIIWGGESGTRALAFSERRSPSKYFDLELLGNQKCLEEFKADVLRTKPLYILSPIETPEDLAFLSMPGLVGRFN